jgi:RNA recognition motif-containing protein
MSNSKLFVHGFRSHLSLQDRKTMIINLFSQYGKIKVNANPRTGKDEEVIIFIRDKEKEGAYKNFCFVEMEDADAMNAVLDNCSNVDFEGGIRLSVTEAKAKQD